MSLYFVEGHADSGISLLRWDHGVGITVAASRSFYGSVVNPGVGFRK